MSKNPNHYLYLPLSAIFILRIKKKCEYMLMCDGERGSGPKGADDLCSVTFEDLGLKGSINNGI